MGTKIRVNIGPDNVAWRHQVFAWTNVDLSPKVFCGIRLRAISQEVFMNLSRNMCSAITMIKSSLHLPGANELIWYM